MDIATGPAVERIARVLAGQRLSANADGNQESAGDAVDATWRDYRDEALAVLHTLRAPSATMAAAGDVAVWERMILAAIDEAQPART
jgi:hypothetical protein